MGEMSSIARAMALLESFQTKDRDLTAAELARRSGLPRSTAYRIAGELAVLGALEQTPDGHFRLGEKVHDLGQLATSQRGLRESAASFLVDLANATHQTVHLGVLDNAEVVFLDVVRPGPTQPLMNRPEARMPATATGLGKAMMAFSSPDVVEQIIARGLPKVTSNSITDEMRLRSELTKIRRTGLAFDHQEHAMGTSCCAAPIFGSSNKVIGAVSVAGPTANIRLDLVATAVQTTAAGISRLQGARYS